MPRRMWEAVETKIGKGGIAKTKGRRKEGRSRKEMERKREKIEEGRKKPKKERWSKESSRRIGDLG